MDRHRPPHSRLDETVPGLRAALYMRVSRSRQFDGREIGIIDGLPDRNSRTSVGIAGAGTGKPRQSPWCSAATRGLPPRDRQRAIVLASDQGQALRVAAKGAAILDRRSTRWRSRTAVGAEEWLRRGRTKESARKQVSCQDFVITIREGRHQFSRHKKQEQSRIFPSDTVAVLTRSDCPGSTLSPYGSDRRSREA
jgi:hypothetical protein